MDNKTSSPLDALLADQDNKNKTQSNIDYLLAQINKQPQAPVPTQQQSIAPIAANTIIPTGVPTPTLANGVPNPELSSYKDLLNKYISMAAQPRDLSKIQADLSQAKEQGLGVGIAQALGNLGSSIGAGVIGNSGNAVNPTLKQADTTGIDKRIANDQQEIQNNDLLSLDQMKNVLAAKENLVKMNAPKLMNGPDGGIYSMNEATGKTTTVVAPVKPIIITTQQAQSLGYPQLAGMSTDMAKTIIPTLIKTSAKGANSPGMDKYSKDAADTVTKWETEGQASAQMAKEKLQTALDMVKSGQVNLGGPDASIASLYDIKNGIPSKMAGAAVGLVTDNPKKIQQVNELVKTASLLSGKAMVGGRMTNDMANAIVSTNFNPLLDNATNEQKLQFYIKRLDDEINQKNAMTDYFKNNNGSMIGYKGPTQTQLHTVFLGNQSGTVNVRNKSTGKIHAIPASDVQTVLQDPNAEVVQ